MMQQNRKLPLQEIKVMSLEEIAEKLRVLEEMPKEVSERVRKEAYDILNTKEYCQMLDIGWVKLTNGNRADYAAMLIVTEGYSF